MMIKAQNLMTKFRLKGILTYCIFIKLSQVTVLFITFKRYMFLQKIDK